MAPDTGSADTAVATEGNAGGVVTVALDALQLEYGPCTHCVSLILAQMDRLRRRMYGVLAENEVVTSSDCHADVASAGSEAGSPPNSRIVLGVAAENRKLPLGVHVAPESADFSIQ